MNLFQKLQSNKITPLLEKKKGHFVVDDNNGIALLVASNYRKNKGSYLLVTSNLFKAQKLYSSLVSFLSKDDVLLFPCDELIRAEAIAQSKEMSAHRLYVLDEILKRDNVIVVANLAAACRYLPEPTLFKSSTFNIKKGGHYDLNEIRKSLVKNGYYFVNKIDQSLQFAIRGDVLDIFSVNNDYPVRIEFFDDEVESIRYFDIAKQTSISMIDEVHPKLGATPNADLYWEIHDLLDTMYKYHGYLPGKLYARAKELAVGRHIAREDIHRQLSNCEE